MTLTIDANVFAADALQNDIHHSESKAFLNAISNSRHSTICPTLVLVETMAAIARPTGNAALAQGAAMTIQQFAGLQMVSLTPRRSQRAAQLAVALRLRGADSVYVATAQEARATLITWDNEMLQRGIGAVSVLTPATWLAANNA